MAESVHAAKVNEQTVIRYICNRAFHVHALFQGRTHFSAHFFTIKFKNGAA